MISLVVSEQDIWATVIVAHFFGGFNLNAEIKQGRGNPAVFALDTSPALESG